MTIIDIEVIRSKVKTKVNF